MNALNPVELILHFGACWVMIGLAMFFIVSQIDRVSLETSTKEFLKLIQLENEL